MKNLPSLKGVVKLLIFVGRHAQILNTTTQFYELRINYSHTLWKFFLKIIKLFFFNWTGWKLIYITQNWSDNAISIGQARRARTRRVTLIGYEWQRDRRNQPITLPLQLAPLEEAHMTINRTWYVCIRLYTAQLERRLYSSLLPMLNTTCILPLCILISDN